MSGKNGSIHPIVNDYNNTKTNMLDMWRESIVNAEKKRHTPAEVAKEENTARAELEQKIRNGQAQCPTCAARTYADQSGDGLVSFQAAKSIPNATAGTMVLGHEGEHVSHEAANAREEGGVASSTMALEYGQCPECGRTYVKGGVTKTAVAKPAIRQSDALASKRASGLDMGV